MQLRTAALVLAFATALAATPALAASPFDNFLKAMKRAGIEPNNTDPSPKKGPLCVCLGADPASLEGMLGVIQRTFSFGQIRLSCRVPKFEFTNGTVVSSSGCNDWILLPKKP